VIYFPVERVGMSECFLFGSVWSERLIQTSHVSHMNESRHNARRSHVPHMRIASCTLPPSHLTMQHHGQGVQSQIQTSHVSHDRLTSQRKIADKVSARISQLPQRQHEPAAPERQLYWMPGDAVHIDKVSLSLSFSLSSCPRPCECVCVRLSVFLCLSLLRALSLFGARSLSCARIVAFTGSAPSVLDAWQCCVHRQRIWTYIEIGRERERDKVRDRERESAR